MKRITKLLMCVMHRRREDKEEVGIGKSAVYGQSRALTAADTNRRELPQAHPGYSRNS